MLFSNLLGKKLRPRQFIYEPRFYNPETDKDRRDRMKLGKGAWEKKFSRKKSAGNPILLFVFVVIIAVLIWGLQSKYISQIQIDDVELTPVDVPVEVQNGQETD